ncbi:MULTISPECIES: ATP-binding protein [unclassified Streptomyces]|uniref:ATP-binding protein n=1 Tax=unclassified Streptomyces TaxID=2593676 RepID=UPI002FC38E19
MNLIVEHFDLAPQRYRMELTVGDHSPGCVRRIVGSYLGLWGLTGLRDAVQLGVSELLTNVHRHVPDRWCRVTVVRLRDGVRVEVEDRGPGLPAPREAGPDEEDGRGLTLLGLVADRHGCGATAEGKAVWFECGGEGAGGLGRGPGEVRGRPGRGAGGEGDILMSSNVADVERSTR